MGVTPWGKDNSARQAAAGARCPSQRPRQRHFHLLRCQCPARLLLCSPSLHPPPAPASQASRPALYPAGLLPPQRIIAAPSSVLVHPSGNAHSVRHALPDGSPRRFESVLPHLRHGMLRKGAGNVPSPRHGGCPGMGVHQGA